MNTRWILILLIAFLPLSMPNFARAQYMYLDANGDSLNTADDRLNATGETTLDVWLDTSHNRDGSTVTCGSGEALTMYSYEFILHAEGGTVSWVGFANHQPTMTTSFGTASDSTDYYRGFGGGTAFGPGHFRLGSLTVAVVSGIPRIDIAQSTDLYAAYLTSFGSQCSGLGEDNTLKLGSDWEDADGVGAPDLPPTISAPLSLGSQEGEYVTITADAVDSLAQAAPEVTVQGYPGSLTLSVTQTGVNSTRAALAGQLGTNDAGTHSIVWTATDAGGLSSSSTTTMDVSNQSQTTGATIVGYTTTGQNVVVSEGTNGIDARLGVWGSVWPWAFCQQGVGYPCTPISNGIEVEIDVDTGGFLSFDFEFMQYGTPFLPDDLQITVGDGNTTVAPVWNYGNPQSCWGNYWQSPRRTIKVDLSQWPGRHVFLNIWVRDCLGHQTDALAIIHSIAIRECYVTPLAPVSAEDQAIFENNPNTPVESLLTDDMKAALACLRAAIPPSGSLVVRSAYRTQSYQAHLAELYKKWKLLEPDTTTIECQDLRTQLKNHIHYHSMDSLKTAPPFDAGNHPKGIAFDANWYNVPDIDALACPCHLYRPLKVTDKHHFVLMNCP